MNSMPHRACTLRVVVQYRPRWVSLSPMLRFAERELPDVVYLEHLCGALYLDKRSETELYSRAFDRLTVDAHTPDHTRQLLAKARAEI